MEYQAAFGIDCGVSLGFGDKHPDYVEEQKRFSAETPQDAYDHAMALAREFAEDYLSDPYTGLTTVRLLSLSGPNEDVPFSASKAVVKRSGLEHLL